MTRWHQPICSYAQLYVYTDLQGKLPLTHMVTRHAIVMTNPLSVGMYCSTVIDQLLPATVIQ